VEEKKQQEGERCPIGKAAGREIEKERERKRAKERKGLPKVGGIIQPFLKSGKKWLGVDSLVEAESASGSLSLSLFFFSARARHFFSLLFFFGENGVKSGDCVGRSHCRGLDFATIISGAESRDPRLRRKYGVLPAGFASFYPPALSYLERARLLLNFLAGYFSGAFNACFIHVAYRRKFNYYPLNITVVHIYLFLIPSCVIIYNKL